MVEKRFTLRMNNEIFEKVKEEAEKERRSTAKQIELILDEYFKDKEKEKESWSLLFSIFLKI